MNEKAKAICAGLAGLPPNQIFESAYGIHNRNAKKSTIMIKMRARESAWNVLKNAHKLKGTKISIQKDLPFNVRQRRAKMIPIMKELREINSSIKISLRDDQLHIAKKVLTWDCELGLRCGEKDGLDAIRNVYGNILLNENLFINEFRTTNKKATKQITLSYNVKYKINFATFFNYVKSFNIFVLYETHLLKNEEIRFKNINFFKL